MFRVYLLACVLFAEAVPSVLVGQKTTVASPPRPAPEITGELIGTSGARRLTLEYKGKAKRETFTGTTHSTCMLPAAQPNSGKGKPLELSAIPRGTLMTVFYVRHAEKGKVGKPSENVILGIRIDRLPGRSSTLPQGVNIPCFKEEPAN